MLASLCVLTVLRICMLLVVACMWRIGLTPLNIGEISYAALGKIIDRYQKKEAYETDIQSILAGADAKKIHPKYWITNE